MQSYIFFSEKSGKKGNRKTKETFLAGVKLHDKFRWNTIASFNNLNVPHFCGLTLIHGAGSRLLPLILDHNLSHPKTLNPRVLEPSPFPGRRIYSRQIPTLQSNRTQKARGEK